MKPRDLWIGIQTHIDANKWFESFLPTLSNSIIVGWLYILLLVVWFRVSFPIWSFKFHIWSCDMIYSSKGIDSIPFLYTYSCYTGVELDLRSVYISWCPCFGCCTLFSSASGVAISEETKLAVFMPFHLVSWCLKAVSSIIAVKNLLHKICVVLWVFYMDKRTLFPCGFVFYVLLMSLHWHEVTWLS